MARIDQSVRDLLSLTEGASQHEIQAAVTSNENVPTVSEAGSAYLVGALVAGECNDVEVLSLRRGSSEWQYLAVKHEDAVVAEFLICPDSNSLVNSLPGLPPTTAETLIVDAWLSGKVALKEFSGIGILRLAQSNIDRSRIDVIALALSCTDNHAVPLASGAMIGKSEVRLSDNSKFLDTGRSFSRLLADAQRETSPRWKYFQLYRVLEQAYLDAILEKLKAEFSASPAGALATANSAIESDFEQLKALIVNSGLQLFAEQIHDIVDAACKSNNKFACAIIRRSKQKYKISDKSSHGAAIIYSIRSSIAHAGVKDIFYEQYDDAPDLVVKTLPILEAAALQLLGISLN